MTAELLIGIAIARGVVQISHEDAFDALSILLAEDYLDQIESSGFITDRTDSPLRTVARLLQFAIVQKLTVPLELSRGEKRVLYTDFRSARVRCRGRGLAQ